MDRSTLSNKIWTACDIMRRDKLYLLQYVEQVSWMLFLKLFEQIEHKSSLGAQVFGQKYQPTIEDEYHWSKWSKLDAKEQFEFVNNSLFPYLQNLHGSPLKSTISSLFEDLRNYMHSPYNFKDVTDLLDGLDFSDPKDTHVISQVYEELLLKMGQEGGASGEFYTPRSIIRLIVNIASPKLGQSIFDPFAGSGGFLAESYSYLMSHNSNITSTEYKNLQENTFYGNEAKALPYLLGIMNMLLHGLQSPHYLKTNTFAEDLTSLTNNERYDLILTNPPFGGIEGKEVLRSFPLKSSDTELLSLYYIMKKMRIGGNAGVILPEGVLTRTGGAYELVKKELVENFNLHTVVSLPAGIFANVTTSGQGPKTSILFFEKGTKTDKIFYYVYHHPEGKRYSKKSPIVDEHINPIISVIKNKKVSDVSWFVDIDEIENKGYNLSAKNISGKPTINIPDSKDLDLELQSLNETINSKQSLLKDRLDKISEDAFPLVLLTSVIELNPSKKEVSDLPSNTDVSFVQMSSVDAESGSITVNETRKLGEVKKGYTYFREDDVLFAKITPCMENGKFAIARNLVNNVGFGSTEFHVLRAGKDVLPEWIYYILRQQSFRDEAKKHMTGTAGQQRVPKDYLQSVEIPLPPKEVQLKIVKNIAEINKLTQELKDLHRKSLNQLELFTESVLHESLK